MDLLKTETLTAETDAHVLQGVTSIDIWAASMQMNSMAHYCSNIWGHLDFCYVFDVWSNLGFRVLVVKSTMVMDQKHVMSHFQQESNNNICHTITES